MAHAIARSVPKGEVEDVNDIRPIDVMSADWIYAQGYAMDRILRRHDGPEAEDLAYVLDDLIDRFLSYRERVHGKA